MTVAAMIVVNNPGNWLSVFPLLQHANWNGCTPADLVFPFFIVIMGMALPFALERRRIVAGQASDLHRRILTRAAILLVLGLLLNATAAWPDLSTVRIPGVLQRIALTYAIAALLILHLRARSQALVGLSLLLAHWALIVLVPFGAESGGIVIPSHNLAGFLDRAAFGAHLLTPTGDPEGLLGVLPSVATALGGAFAGRWIRDTPVDRSPVVGLVVGGATAVAIGVIWSTVWPMNKPLWTASYAVFSTGLATLALTACYLLVDTWEVGLRWTQPFVWLGINPLAVYFGSELVGHLIDQPTIRHGAALVSIKDELFWRWIAAIVRDGGGNQSSLAFALAYVGLWTLVAGLLYRRGITVHV